MIIDLIVEEMYTEEELDYLISVDIDMKKSN